MLESLVLGFENFVRDVLGFFNEENEKDSRHSMQCANILLSDVKHPDLYFYLNGVTPIKSLYELSQKMNEIDEKTFMFHVNDKRNDFAEWVEKNVGDKLLAEKMHSTKSLKRMGNMMNVRVEWLKSRI